MGDRKISRTIYTVNVRENRKFETSGPVCVEQKTW